ncbi:MAG: ABC transporter ATP-binding protein [Treponema sp.]|nr:ABC transporter ATP-binding protein [Treponema sp.]
MVESLSIKNLYVSSGRKKILNGLSLELKKGELLCLCGSNGCGKSTLLSVIAGTEAPGLKITSDEDGFLPKLSDNPLSIKSLPPKARAKIIAYMAQEEKSMWDFTVFDIVLSGRFSYTKNGNYSAKDKEAAANAINQLGISHLAQKSVFEISYGEFQKTRIARALCQDADFLLLDEPTANLDFVYEPKLLEILVKIAKNGKGIMIAIHNINLAARFADRIILLSPGQKEISGSPQEVFTNENLKKAFSPQEEFVILDRMIDGKKVPQIQM